MDGRKTGNQCLPLPGAHPSSAALDVSSLERILSVCEQLWVYRTVMEMMGHVTLLADRSDHGAGRGSLPAYSSQS